VKSKIPTPVFVAVIVVFVAVIGYVMYSRAVPAQRPEGAPSNLERAVTKIRENAGTPITSEKFRNRKKD
jgi:hypothetical protein